MIKNFYKVRPNLYRGSAPSLKDVIVLHNKFNIENIISLDDESGNYISPICKKLNLNHTIIPIDVNKINSLKYLLSKNISSLINDGPTFVHCRRGKDRTGLFIALVRCLFDDWDCKKALQEAKLLGFGTGLDFPIEKFYTKLICKSCNNDHIDENNVYDIMSNLSDMNAQYRDYELDPYQYSWAPYADESIRSYPEGIINQYYEGENTTRSNHDLKGINIEEKFKSQVPQVGVYDQNTQITNFTGPSLVGGGFI